MALPDGYIEARWVPVWEAELPDGKVNAGDIWVVSASEAETSENWEPVIP